MTAEIALLNRRAIAFAADSAVTISGSGPDKIYNSAEKVFEFSRKMPIGLMLYNTLEFVGVPFDVIIRKFRSECDKEFSTCKEACECFLAYLSAFKRGEEDEDAHFESVIIPEFYEIKKEYNKRYRAELVDEVTKSSGKFSKPSGGFDFDKFKEYIAIDIINNHKTIHESNKLSGYLDSVDLAQFSNRFESKVEECAKSQGDVLTNKNVIAELIKLAYAVVKSEIFSDSLSGIVIGGFGHIDLFPSLYAVEIDGIYFGELKSKVIREVDIDRRGERAAIVPFAQSEMVERFLYGIDVELESKLLRYVERSSEKAFNKVKWSAP